MPKLKYTEIEILKEILNHPNGAGYVLNFSDPTFGLFFEEEFQIDIHSGKYQLHGTSKFKKLQAFLEIESATLAARVLRALWEHRAAILENNGVVDQVGLSEKYFAIIQRLEGNEDIIRTDALEKFMENQTLDELIAAIQRDVNAKKPEAGLDRLHTYCMKKFSHLLSLRGVMLTDDTPLHSRAGLYVKALEASKQLQDMSLKIMKSNLSVFEDFNHVRNKRTFAHDNQILETAEARYIFESICNLLRFIRSIESMKFGE